MSDIEARAREVAEKMCGCTLCSCSSPHLGGDPCWHCQFGTREDDIVQIIATALKAHGAAVLREAGTHAEPPVEHGHHEAYIRGHAMGWRNYAATLAMLAHEESTR